MCWFYYYPQKMYISTSISQKYQKGVFMFRNVFFPKIYRYINLWHCYGIYFGVIFLNVNFDFYVNYSHAL